MRADFLMCLTKQSCLLRYCESQSVSVCNQLTNGVIGNCASKINNQSQLLFQ